MECSQWYLQCQSYFASRLQDLQIFWNAMQQIQFPLAHLVKGQLHPSLNQLPNMCQKHLRSSALHPQVNHGSWFPLQLTWAQDLDCIPWNKLVRFRQTGSAEVIYFIEYLSWMVVMLFWSQTFQRGVCCPSSICFSVFDVKRKDAKEILLKSLM